MDAERERIERARAKNLAYIQQQDEQEASQAADELLSSVVGSPASTSSSVKRSTPASSGSKGNSSVYITGLTTYMACRQLGLQKCVISKRLTDLLHIAEGVCNKLGKVRRIKFYKDEKGGLKGDAVVTYSSRATMLKAVDRLNHFEVKPGVTITYVGCLWSNGEWKKLTHSTRHRATEAIFSSKKKEESIENAGATQAAVQDQQATATPLKVAAAEDSSHLDSPSRSIILKHIWDPLEASDAGFFDELEEDMRSECGKHGAVGRVQVVADGSVVVRFAELNAAIACLKVMNGRWFAGRQIEAQFDQASAENPSDADTKVEAFLASLGE
ncbi:HIV Tat-specific factor 1 [Phytophthora citrophthora]|uniref:HIV Tat-specific factor 1 n=1 Tax=Phytophthora citrophthora TaxID=4793 RepID=A0AAD9LSD9_9STRA|nr:HIV Tat-specific factor 1 [Phytophthora citrophthora]